MHVAANSAWALTLALTLASCRVQWGTPADDPRSQQASGPVVIYTSMYRPVVEALTAALKEDLPAIQQQWYQAGSEKVASRLDAELAAGACPADLLATSDPSHFSRLKAQGALAVHVPPGALRVPRALVDLDGTSVTMRLSTMVLAWHQEQPNPPQRMADLWNESFRDSTMVGDPLSSGTFFTTLAILERVHGPGLFEAMRRAGVVAAGGNSAVQDRLLGREKRAGLLLLENVLMAQAGGAPLAWRVPADGVVLVPGPLGMLHNAPHPGAAAAVMDWLLSTRAQQIVVEVGRMHSPLDNVGPPSGAPPLETLMDQALGLEQDTWRALRDEGAAVKARFSAAYGR